MLKQLTINNFALIEHLELEFSSGLNVLTGETGAGKSIIIDAVGLLLGQRARQEYIRKGSKKAEVSGLFEINNRTQVKDLLQSMGLPLANGEILLARQVSLSGNNTCRVNGQPVTLGMYQKFGEFLIDIHGQHDHQSLLFGDKQRELLDNFCGFDLKNLKISVENLFTKWREVKKKLLTLEHKAQEMAREEGYLKFQLEEIEKAALTPGEEEELEREKQRLNGVETLASGSEKIRNLLYDASSSEIAVSAYDAISQSLNEVETMVKYDEDLKKVAEFLQQAQYQVEEAISQLRYYSEDLYFDPERLDQVESRLHLIIQLKRKYGSSVEDVLAYRDQAAASLEELSNQLENQDQLKEEIDKLEENYYQAAELLTEQRKVGAERLIGLLADTWKDLAMAATQFQIDFNKAAPDIHGQDEIEFLISPNPGEELKPLAKIASGGELSRVMLALKTALAEIDQVPTMIFDEIDTGIGGKTIVKVAEKLSMIASHRQVLCVTHSAVIAAQATRHFAISKKVSGERTMTTVATLDYDRRVDEVARMLGGFKQITVQHAKKLLE